MGHDHDVIAASPEAFEGQYGPAPEPRAPLWRSVALGALVAAACGCLEMSVRLHAELTPSVARRALVLLANAALAYAPVGALAALGGALLSRLFEVRFVPGFQRALAGLAFFGLGGAALVAAAAPARLAPAAAPAAPAATRAQGPHLILIVVDTLRADALGAYGGPPTPAFDALAAGGLVFEEAIAPSSWTLPSMASLFTGAYPAEHRYTDFDGRLDRETAPLVLAEALAEAGYACRGVVGNTLLAPAQGFARGFELYDAYDFALERDLWLNRAVNAVLRRTGHVRGARRALVPVLEGRFPFVGTRLTFYNLDGDLTERVFAHALGGPAPERPLFLFVHYLAPHTPYLEHPLTLTKRAPEPGEVSNEALRALYDGEVAYTDTELGRLLAGLEARGLLEDALICVTADHGEAFGEHGRFEHGYDLHREAVRVPWILAGSALERTPLSGRRRHADPVSLSDLAPTLLDLLGVTPTVPFEGRSLVPAVAGIAAAPTVFAETSSRYLTPDAHHLAAYAGTRRLLRVITGATAEDRLFDVALDADETEPLEDVAPELSAALETYARRAAGSRDSSTSGADVERMEALGYLGGAEASKTEAAGDEPPR